MTDRSLTLCVCTMDRVDILRRCLESIMKGSQRPDDIIVSDDSPNGTETAMLCGEFPAVTYVRGPQRGLCSNRNWVVRQAVTTHVSLIDDDGVLSEDFVAVARGLMQECSDNVMITGVVNEENSQIIPFNPSFWGHFVKPPSARFENINLNCNLLPRRAFDYASFDESITYGYEDMDLCAQLLFAGFQIQFEPRLQNAHIPPKRSVVAEKKRFPGRERARFYTSVKRYLLWKKNYARLFAFLVLAPIHRALHSIKIGFWFDLKYCIPDMAAAIQGGLREKAKLKQLTIEPSHARYRPRS